jgi:hypothetical protein
MIYFTFFTVLVHAVAAHAVVDTATSATSLPEQIHLAYGDALDSAG